MVTGQGESEGRSKPSICGLPLFFKTQGSICDDVGAVGMLSTRSIVVKGRGGKRHHETKKTNEGITYFSEQGA